MKPVVAIAMSGGIDSLAAASLLKDEGTPVFGIHFTTGFESPDVISRSSGLSDLGKQLGFPIHIVDLSCVFRTSVVDYFIRTYLGGLTPNPCLVCNPVVKFDTLFRKARDFGADILATGHYAIVKQDTNGRFRLFRGADRNKDQSYFLSFLTQDHLSKACFPLGGMTKAEVVAFAAEKGLSPVFESESQDICFIHGEGYSDFLLQYGGVQPESGPVVTVEGETIGTHSGLHHFTVGQRRGINCPSTEPYYVLRLCPETNTLVVGRKTDLLSHACRVSSLHWIVAPPALPITADVRLRYRHQAVPADLSTDPEGDLTVQFHIPQLAPTPGQGAVFYSNNEVIGAGIISS
jgi:tRNA-specific 2-thiouridylase